MLLPLQGHCLLTKARYCVLYARAVVGASVTLLLDCPDRAVKLILHVISAESDTLNNSTEFEWIVVASIDSLKSTMTLAVLDTLVEPDVGVCAITVVGVVSGGAGVT